MRLVAVSSMLSAIANTPRISSGPRRCRSCSTNGRSSAGSRTATAAHHLVTAWAGRLNHATPVGLGSGCLIGNDSNTSSDGSSSSSRRKQVRRRVLAAAEAAAAVPADDGQGSAAAAGLPLPPTVAAVAAASEPIAAAVAAAAAPQKGSLGKRVVFGVILGLSGAAVILSGGWVYGVVACLAAYQCSREFTGMVRGSACAPWRMGIMPGAARLLSARRWQESARQWSLCCVLTSTLTP